jgi:hypothetical protein
MIEQIPGWGAGQQQRRRLARLAAAHRVSAADEVIDGLRRELTALGVPEDTMQTLLAGAKVLLPVAGRAGVELAVSAGPGHDWAVRVGGDTAVPEPRRASVEASVESGSRPDVAAQLAQLLRDGGGYR